MSVTAAKLELTKQRRFVPVSAMQGLVGSAGVGTGVPVHEEMATLLPGIGALEMASANDDIAHLELFPSNFDRHHPIKVRAIWSSQSTTGADTVDWKFLYLAITLETTAIAIPSTALDTAIAQDTVAGTINVLQGSPWGTINAKSIADAATHWAWLMEMDAKAAGLTEKVYLHGVEFEYTPKISKRGLFYEAKDWSA